LRRLFGLRQLDEERLTPLDHGLVRRHPHEENDSQQKEMEADRHADGDGERALIHTSWPVHTHLPRL
jgi:hypothetical protein